MRRREQVVVTGLGFLTPLGDRPQAIVTALKETRTATALLPGLDYSAMPARFGSWIDPVVVESYQLDPFKFKRYNQYVKYGVIATRNALEDAGLLTGSTFAAVYPEARRGVYVSTGINGENAEGLFEGFAAASRPDGSLDRERFAAEGIDLVHPRWILSTISNNLIFFLTSEFGLKGDNNNVTYTAVGGCYMIDAALNALEEGVCDLAVVTGADSVINWQAQDDLAKSGLFRDDPGEPEATAMAPFTREARGALPGEGAASLVLEMEGAAAARGARPYARLLGSRQFCCGSDLLAPHRGGGETAAVLLGLVEEAGSPHGPTLINLNGASVPAWDRAEIAGLAKALETGRGAFGGDPICTSSKPYFCHTYSASFVLDVAATVLALHHGFLFPPPLRPDVPDLPAAFCDGVTGGRAERAIVLGQGLGGNTGGVILGPV